MTIISHNQDVKAGIAMHSGRLHIDFIDDPSFIRSETVIIDMMQRSIGIIFQNGYHHIGPLPSNVEAKDIEDSQSADLSGHGAGGRKITLHAPIKLVSNKS